MTIFIAFKPLNIKSQKLTDIPSFEISSFTLHELTQFKLNTLMFGLEAVRFTDRYEITNMDYTDNSQKLLANMKSKNGIYKNSAVYLSGDVKYIREDGMEFESQNVIYDKLTTVATSNVQYIAHQGANVLTGDAIVYNSLHGTMISKNITATYQLQER